jgi:hypothetical protein
MEGGIDLLASWAMTNNNIERSTPANNSQSAQTPD